MDDMKHLELRLPLYLWEELADVCHDLKRRAPDYKWSQNKIICEAVRVWIVKVKEQLDVPKRKDMEKQ